MAALDSFIAPHAFQAPVPQPQKEAAPVPSGLQHAFDCPEDSPVFIAAAPDSHKGAHILIVFSLTMV